jgi:hypothetical protein
MFSAGQTEVRHGKCKGFKVGGGKAVDLSSDQAAASA